MNNWLRAKKRQLLVLLGLRPELTYYCAAAIRGPDLSGCDSLKTHVTARIRSIFFSAAELTAEFQSSPLQEGDLHVLARKISHFESQGPDSPVSHYLSHLTTAVYNTSQHKVWGGLAPRLIRVLQGEGA